MCFLEEEFKFKLSIEDEMPTTQSEGLISNSAFILEQSKTEYKGLGAIDLNSAEVTFLRIVGTL